MRPAAGGAPLFRAALPAALLKLKFVGLTADGVRLPRARYPNCGDITGTGCYLLNASGPSRAQSASRSLRRALLTPQASAGSRYRCGNRTFKRAACGLRRVERGPEIRPQKLFSQARPLHVTLPFRSAWATLAPYALGFALSVGALLFGATWAPWWVPLWQQQTQPALPRVWSTCDEEGWARPALSAIQKGTRVLISLWDSLMSGRVPGTRPNIRESAVRDFSLSSQGKAEPCVWCRSIGLQLSILVRK